MHSTLRTASPLLGPLVAACAATIIVLVSLVAAPQALALLAGVVLLCVAARAAKDKPEVALIALIASATLDVHGRIAEIGPLKLTLYQVLLAGVVVYAAWRLWTHRSRITTTPVDAPLLLFMGFVVASIIGAVDPVRSVVALVSLLSSALLVYLVVVLADTPKALERLVLGVLAIAAVFAVLALLEAADVFFLTSPLRQWGGLILPHVTFGDPNMLGSFLMVGSMLGLPLVTVVEDRRMKAAIAAAAILCAFALVKSTSRGALGAFMIALAVLFLASRERTSVKAAVIAFTLVSLVAFADPVSLFEHARTVVLDASTETRLLMGRSALEMACDNPFGVGADNYPLVYPAYRDAFTRWNLVESHTMPLTLLVEYGVFGLFAFFWMLWRAMTRTYTVQQSSEDPTVRAVAYGALAAGIGIIAQSFTYSFETNKFLWLTIGVGMAAYTIWKRQTIEEDV